MKLTIITINCNNAEGLAKTLESVNSQVCKNFEHVIIDGASTDNSVDIIHQYEDASIKRVWISEPDSGIYNAMNKGIRMASGEYIQILNSGDCLYSDDVVQEMLTALDSLEKSHVGEIMLLQANMMKDFGSYYMCDKGFQGRKPTMMDFVRGTINHNPVYVRRSLFDKYGFYDESLKIVSDFKWYLQVVILGNEPLDYVDIDCTTFDMTGISETNFALREKEREAVLQELIPQNILLDYKQWYSGVEQLKRIKSYTLVDKLFWFVERCLFKYEKMKQRNKQIIK